MYRAEVNFCYSRHRDLLRQDDNSVIVEVEFCYKGGDTNGKPQIDKTNHLQEAYEFGKHIYDEIMG